jgi:cell pole-organizing protein PopZ
MSQPAKAQEPSMEEILASIRRIIADDDTAKPAAKPAAAPAAPRPVPPPPLPPRVAAPTPSAPPAPRPAVAPPPPAATMNQADIDAMLAARQPAPQPQEDVLELTEAMAEQDDSATNFQTIDGQPDVVFADAPAPAEPQRSYDEPPRQAPPSAFDRTIISANTSAAVDSAFNSLAHTVLVQNARTLEDLVREMLRPMLKSWLDDNLPSMVERIVRAEIERVSRGRS